MADESERSGASVPEGMIVVAGVALAGIIQVSSTSGPFNLWNVMIGVTLLLILSVFSGGTNLNLQR